MSFRFKIGFASIVTASLFTGCATSNPHNDVLIFGTDTSVGVDVGANATSGGTPQVSIGYQRKEAVWMPLLANARHATASNQGGNFYEGQSGTSTDAYSVFASFGAELEGSAGAAKVGLAQFFATGIAAQKMAGNPASVLALSVKGEKEGKSDGDAVAKVAAAQSFGFTEDTTLANGLDDCFSDYQKVSNLKNDGTIGVFASGFLDAGDPDKFKTFLARNPKYLKTAIDICGG